MNYDQSVEIDDVNVVKYADLKRLAREECARGGDLVRGDGLWMGDLVTDLPTF